LSQKDYAATLANAKEGAIAFVALATNLFAQCTKLVLALMFVKSG